MIFIVFVSIVFFAYGTLILALYFGWKKLIQQVLVTDYSGIKVSVVIAARNEAHNLNNLLEDIKNQIFAIEDFEIIIIDDHSTDETLNQLFFWQKKIKNLHVVRLSETQQGKKNAIRLGIEVAVNELIVTTDADCRFGLKWLSSLAAFYKQYTPQLIVAPLLYDTNGCSVFGKMQALESLSLVASGAGALGIQHPIMCNGANLAFRKSSYLKHHVALKTETASGDDVFLLLALKKEGAGAIRFLNSIDAAVYTFPELKLKSFLAQRKRWTSKSKYYKDFDIISMALIVGILNGLLLTLLVGALFKPLLFICFFAGILLKSMVDLPLLISFSKYFGKAQLIKYFWATQLIYPIYIVFNVVYGNLGKIKWKDRTYN